MPPIGPTSVRPCRKSQRLRRIRPHAHKIVQIEQHRRTLRRRHQQILELAERMRTNHIALIAGHQHSVESLFHEHIEVVEPEVGHHLIQLPLAVDGAQNFRLHQLAHHYDRRIVHGEQGFLLLRAQSFEKLLPFASA